MAKLLLIGGGGHCKSVLDSILSKECYEDIGIVDHNFNAKVMGTQVVGSDEDLWQLRNQGWTDAFITIGSVGNTAIRRELYQLIEGLGFFIPNICDPSAEIARSVVFNKGAFVGKNAVVNSESKVGCCSIINTGSIIEHECSIGDFSHISPGAILCGQVSIGTDSHIGANCVIRQQIRVGNNAIIGAGSVVLSDIPDGSKAYGNPCRVEGKWEHL